jgi:hypothetical protein
MEKSNKFPVVLALLLGFAPAAALLWVVRGKPSSQLCIVLAMAALICCFSSSFLLFRRKTTLAIISGIFLVLLNLAVSFLFGCAALLSGL